MMKVIKSIDAYHNNYVAEAVSSLQKNGYNVKSIKRISRMVLLFGNDVTHITYEKDSI